MPSFAGSQVFLAVSYSNFHYFWYLSFDSYMKSYIRTETPPLSYPTHELGISIFPLGMRDPSLIMHLEIGAYRFPNLKHLKNKFISSSILPVAFLEGAP